MSKRLYLGEDRKVAGVCGGVARYLDIDPTIIRILWLAAFLFYGSGLLAYLICWIVIPKHPTAF